MEPEPYPSEEDLEREFQRCVLTPLVVPEDDVPDILLEVRDAGPVGLHL